MTSTLARQEKNYEPKEDPNYINICENHGVKDEVYDEKRKCLKTISSQSPMALDEFLEPFLRIANIKGEKNSNDILRILILYYEDAADIVRRKLTAHVIRSLKALLSIKQIESIKSDRLQNTLKDLKFSPYGRDPVNVLRRHVLLTQKSGIIVKPAGTETESISYPIKSKVDGPGCRAADMFIKNSAQREVVWCTPRNHGEQSFGRALRG